MKESPRIATFSHVYTTDVSKRIRASFDIHSNGIIEGIRTAYQGRSIVFIPYGSVVAGIAFLGDFDGFTLYASGIPSNHFHLNDSFTQLGTVVDQVRMSVSDLESVVRAPIDKIEKSEYYRYPLALASLFMTEAYVVSENDRNLLISTQRKMIQELLTREDGEACWQALCSIYRKHILLYDTDPIRQTRRGILLTRASISEEDWLAEGRAFVFPTLKQLQEAYLRE